MHRRVGSVGEVHSVDNFSVGQQYYRAFGFLTNSDLPKSTAATTAVGSMVRPTPDGRAARLIHLAPMQSRVA
jgi:hypothetical protein